MRVRPILRAARELLRHVRVTVRVRPRRWVRGRGRRQTLRHTGLVVVWLSVVVAHPRTGELAEALARKVDESHAWRRSL
jgi:hypothetical protein